jgi:glycosyltransferase involved in cell wall biosynthesis
LALSFESMPDLEIHWIVLDRKERKAATTVAHGQTFHRIPGVKFSIDVALGYLPARLSIRKVLKRIQPDVVHAWGTERIYPAALQDCRVPTIVSMQGVLTEYQRISGLGANWIWRKMVASEPAMIRSATIVTSESQWGIDCVRKIHPTADCRMVEYGVHPDFYELAWHPAPDVPYALFVGGSGYRKGFDLLVEALKSIPDRTWEMRLAGDASMAAACDAAGLTNIRPLGLLSWPEMQKQLQGAWCSVLPTRGDTSANSVKEARVVGVPVVASRHGGHAGYIADNINGRIVDPLDAPHLAAALEDVMSSFDRATSLGKGNHEKDRTYLRPERTAEGFADIYRELFVQS